MQFALYTERPPSTSAWTEEGSLASSRTAVGDGLGVGGLVEGVGVEGVEGVEELDVLARLPVDSAVGAFPSSEHPTPRPTLKMSPQ
jgi:hypothetical protein